MSPLRIGCLDWSYADFFLFISFWSLWYSFSSGGVMTHQHRLQGVPAPNRTRTQSSCLTLDRSIIMPILFKALPLPAINAPVYASCRDEYSNIASRIPAVHCISE